MIKHASGLAPSMYPPPPPPALGNVRTSGPDTPQELQAIFHTLMGAVDRIRIQDQQLTEAVQRMHGTWPVEAGNAECAPNRDGLVPALAAACDALHRAIDRMQLPIDIAAKL